MDEPKVLEAADTDVVAALGDLAVAVVVVVVVVVAVVVVVVCPVVGFDVAANK